MKGVLPSLRLKRVDKEIMEMLKSGAEPKKIARRTKLPYKMVVKKIEKLRRLGLA